MEEDLGDWGLLSISDILDTDIPRKNEVSPSSAISLTEVEISLLSCAPIYAIRYVQSLIKNSKSAVDQRINGLEELDTTRSIKLRRSLATSEFIREKMLGAVESFVLMTGEETNKPGFLRSIALLGPIVCPDIRLFFNAFVEGVEAMIFRMDYTQSDISQCVEVIQSFQSGANVDVLTAEQRRRLCSAEFSLALRCGKLSAVVNCLLHVPKSKEVEKCYRTPPMQYSIGCVRTEMDCFLTRVCDLPCSVHPVPVYCFPNDEKLFLCSRSRGWVLDQLGMMGTRFKVRQQFDISSRKGARIIHCNEKKFLAVYQSSSATGGLRYVMERWDREPGKQPETSEISFCFDDNSAAARDVVFDVYGSTLTCLVCSKASRLSNSKCYLVSGDVDVVLSKSRSEFQVGSQHALRRGPCSWPLRNKCYYFTKTNCISVGRVTLKENFHPFSIELWVYPCNCSDNQAILSIGDKNADEILIEIEPTSDGVLLRGGTRTPHLGVSFVSYHIPGKPTFCYRWWHLGLLFKGNSWELWVNDSVVAQAPALVWPEAISDAVCCLGKSFVGFLVEVRIWNCYRPAPQLYRDGRRSLTGAEATLVGYYPLDEGEGDIIADHAPGGSHTILHHGQANWSSVDTFPVEPPRAMRYIDEFAPITWRESSGSIYFSSSPGYVALAVLADGPCLMICEYAVHNLLLMFQVRVDLPSRTALKDLAYNGLRHSLVCYASSADHPRRLLVWELHKQHHLFLKETYKSIWDCERDLLTQCSAYAGRVVSSERCLIDQLACFVQLPTLVVDASEGLLGGLLKLIRVVLLEQKERDHAAQLCSLLHANLLYRVERDPEVLKREIGAPFPDAQSLINVAQCCGEATDPRNALLRLSFQESFFDTGLLSMTCRCLLSGGSRLAFIKGQAGRPRLTEKEDMLFRSLLEYYESVQASSSLITNAESAQLFCTSLMAEEIFQVERWISRRGKAVDAVKSVSRCLEVFQEILLAKTVEERGGDCGGYVASYAKLLLKTSEKIIESFLKAIHTKPENCWSGLVTCMEYSTVGSLLPSFSVAFSLLPTSVQANCVPYLKGCREALFSLTEALPGSERLPYDLGVALTSALCRIGCSLLVSSDMVTVKVDPKYLQLMSCGIRKIGSERDAIIKNLQQGVGSISKVVEELRREDPGALLVLRDSRLMKLECLLMASFCALLMPTESLRRATKQNLSPMFRHVHNMRPLVLSIRQEDPEYLEVIGQRALFLARFEPICGSRTEGTPRVRRYAKDVNPQKKWRRFFQIWKALRSLKTKLPQQRDADVGDMSAIIVQFLHDKKMGRDSVDRLVAQQTQRAQYRLSGMLLLRQLMEEARVSEPLAKIVLPVLAKTFTGWHYADSVQCCSKEDFLRLHGAFFQLLELVVGAVGSEERNLWADTLLALLTSELRVTDFQRMRGDVATKLRTLWRFENRRTAGCSVLNGNIPEVIRSTLLSPGGTAPSLVVGRSGCTLKGLGCRGTSVAPCEWSLGRKSVSYFFEVQIVDLCPGANCCIGVGPAEYNVSRLPGWDGDSYALHSSEGVLYEGNTLGRPVGCTFGIGDVVGCGWNTEARELYWTKNGRYVVATAHVLQQQLHPLIGISGRGLVKVNFGRDRFVFDKLKVSRPPRRNIGERAWDVFRMFSLRAALCAVELRNDSSSSPDSAVEDIRARLEQCFGCICAEIDRAISLPLSEPFITSLCSHLTVLAKVLTPAQGEILTPCVQCVVTVLQKGTNYALTDRTCSSRLRCSLITAWCSFMNLAPPQAIVEDDQYPRFLETLLSLARELEWGAVRKLGSVGEVFAPIEAWTALALLQRMNCHNSTHYWGEKLHAWIVQSVGDTSDYTNISLALRIINGASRLAVPGDRIVVHKSKHTKLVATVVDYSLEDETCEVIECEEKRQTVSLRRADIVVGDDSSLFPQTGNMFHQIQLTHVFQLAQSLCSEREVEDVTLKTSLHYRVLAIFWQCAQRGFLTTASGLIPLLSRALDNVESTPDGYQVLLQERLVIENCLLGRAVSATDSASNGNSHDSKPPAIPEVGDPPGASARELRARLAQELSMRGYNIDLCFMALDETGNDPHAALQLLGDHHEDFMSARRRTTPSTTDDEDISTDEAEETAEYDMHDIFSPESEDGMNENVSVDQCDSLTDCIRFLGGYVSITFEHSLGDQFTVDLQLYLFDVTATQDVLYQLAAQGEWELVARVQDSSFYCGWMRRGDAGPSLCKAPIGYSSTTRWVQLTVVQGESRFSLYKCGVLQCDMEIPFRGRLFESGLHLGGCADDEETRLNGGIRDVRFYSCALTSEEVSRLTAMRSDGRLPQCTLRLECTSETIKAVTADPRLSASLAITGAVTWFEQISGHGRTGDVCNLEVDLTTQNGEGGIFAIETVNEDSSVSAVWFKRKDQPREQIFAAIQKLDRQLICYYAVAITTHLMSRTPEPELCLTPEQVRRMVQFVVNSSDANLFKSFGHALQHIAMRENISIINYAMQELVDVLQREQKMLVLESSHPFKSALETAHEVHVPGRREYELHFDTRCSSNMLVTFCAEHTLSTVIAHAPGYALNSLCIRASRFFIDVRIDISAAQWGYKIAVLYDLSVARSAAQLVRTTLSAVTAKGMERVPFLRTRECFGGLENAVRVNVGVTRRLILSCLTDLFLHVLEYAEPMPPVTCVHDLRRMSERLFRQAVGPQHLHSRFVQVVSEFYVAFSDAEQCLSLVDEERKKVLGRVYDASADADRFQRKRLEQRNLYKRREGLRVNVEKVLHVESLRVGVNQNKTILACSELSGSSLIADVPLGRGRWYFEVRMMSTGDVFIGVLPSRTHSWTDLPTLETFVAFNGKTGTYHGVKNVAVAPRRIWKAKDYVGVVMDGAQKICSFFVNGQDTGLFFPFGENEVEATAAAGARAAGEQEVIYHPLFVLDEAEGVTINFGGAHFEYELPRNCFPLDPANLTLGTLIPYNQVRAFHDLAAYFASGGRTTLPPFFHEEANPFENSTERLGPPHVSLHSTSGVQVSLLHVRNTGLLFATVRANCRVTGGKWYYEVMLRSQGLMQIGWSSSNESREDSVGDTAGSWSVDLFRRVKWHDGKAEPFTSSRRWVVGDVIGCAIDLVAKKMIFSCNGRLLCDTNLFDCTFTGLPDGLSYEPAVSMRAGNEVMFNFGSSTLRYKPEGFCALGVPDSWNERIDAFYSTLRPSTTLLRLQALRSIWLSADKLLRDEVLTPYENVVAALEQYCRQHGKSIVQVTEDVCADCFRDSSVSVKKALEAYRVLVAFSRVAQTVIPLLHLDTRHPNVSTKLFLMCRTLIFTSIRNEMVDDIVRETNVRCEHFRVSINRVNARANKASWMSSVFGQTFSLVADQNPRIFCTNRRFWSVVFLGEGAEDVGGPFREHISEMCRELMSTELPLFVPTANNVHNTGSYRDAFVPAASALSDTELSAYVFVGQLMGGALRNNEPLGLFFPPLVWKFLCFYPITESDIDDIDRICLQCIREFRSLNDRLGSSDMYDEVFDSETFTTRLSDGTLKELIAGGSGMRVTFDRCGEYADALSAARMSEFNTQLQKIREGLLNVIPETVLCLLTPSELEQRVCGKADYTVEELRGGTVYEGLTSDDRRVQLLWQALEDATMQQRRLFLRFVSGRDRLPVKLRILPLLTSDDADSTLPRAATCFFALELPDYSSLEVMKAKLYYSIENCADIDADFNPPEVDEAEAPQLMIGVEDARQDEAESTTPSD
ncbi:Concanavalin A-like lectin [Trypanosoma brucei equiperdum]|uniref:Concanavalin A-like lectin n=1 Tax=Trypanosoma brucei equiperdum TaxID=630700 RepID=A0A3L6L228_9TRYP|nr:Concanavalin A-like lectin [Trypanosoma brucei equiperdum]